MALARTVGAALISATATYLRGTLTGVDGPCGTTIPHLRYEWSKPLGEFSAPEQTAIGDAKDMLEGYLVSEEACADRRDWVWFELNTSGAGVVTSVRCWVRGPTVAGVQREMWGYWRRDRVSFWTVEREQLDAVVAMLTAYLASEEPLT